MHSLLLSTYNTESWICYNYYKTEAKLEGQISRGHKFAIYQWNFKKSVASPIPGPVHFASALWNSISYLVCSRSNYFDFQSIHVCWSFVVSKVDGSTIKSKQKTHKNTSFLKKNCFSLCKHWKLNCHLLSVICSKNELLKYRYSYTLNVKFHFFNRLKDLCLN